MTDFKKILIMILAFIVFFATVLTEVTDHFVLSDFAILLFVMFFVSVVPALGGVVYKWMFAENEDDPAVQEELSKKRMKIVLPIALVVVLACAARLIMKYFA